MSVSRYYIAVQGARNLTIVSHGFDTLRDALEAALNRRSRGKRADAIKECSNYGRNVRHVYHVDAIAHEYEATV